MVTKPPHADTAWFEKVRKIQNTILRIDLAQLKGQFCDQAGWPLKVGDKTNKGIILRIVKSYAVTENGKFHFSYLKKES